MVRVLQHTSTINWIICLKLCFVKLLAGAVSVFPLLPSAGNVIKIIQFQLTDSKINCINHKRAYFKMIKYANLFCAANGNAATLVVAI